MAWLCSRFMKVRVLVVEDDTRLRTLLSDLLIAEGHQVTSTQSAEAAEKYLETETFDVVLTDVNLPGKSGLDLLPICIRHNPDTYLIVMTGFASIEIAVEAMKLGASDFLCKPVSLKDLTSAVEIARQKLAEPVVVQSSQTISSSPIIAQSVVMLNVLEQVKIIAPYKINVLITGETGTGKELIARAVHLGSPRAKKAFVALNCAAIPEQLLEDELFGHVKGAYTGAQKDREGRFEQADGGTLFLDEIGDMNLPMQAKLLRVLQESEFERLGSSKTIKVDVRVVAATSSDLERKIVDGEFRADLFHRLNVVHLSVPALRERPDDIRSLSEGLIDRFCKSAGLPPKTIDAKATEALLAYSFPGNVRQLQNAVERAAVFSGVGPVVLLEHLPEEFSGQSNIHTAQVDHELIPADIPDEGINFSDVVSQVERALLVQTLNKTKGNRMQAAKLLNMKRTTLVEKIKRLKIESFDDTDGSASTTIH